MLSLGLAEGDEESSGEKEKQLDPALALKTGGATSQSSSCVLPPPPDCAKLILKHEIQL